MFISIHLLGINMHENAGNEDRKSVKMEYAKHQAFKISYQSKTHTHTYLMLICCILCTEEEKKKQIKAYWQSAQTMPRIRVSQL